MEPVGITNACTSVVVRNSSSRMVITHSDKVLRGNSSWEGDPSVVSGLTSTGVTSAGITSV